MTKVYSCANSNNLKKYLLTYGSLKKYSIGDEYYLICAPDVDKSLLPEDVRVIDSNITYELLYQESAKYLADSIDDSDNITLFIGAGILIKIKFKQLLDSSNFDLPNIESIIKNDEVMEKARLIFNKEADSNHISLLRIGVDDIDPTVFEEMCKEYNFANIDNSVPGGAIVFGKSSVVKKYYRDYVDFCIKNKETVDLINSKLLTNENERFDLEVCKNSNIFYNIFIMNKVINKKYIHKDLHSNNVKNSFIPEFLTSEEEDLHYADISALYVDDYLEAIRLKY